MRNYWRLTFLLLLSGMTAHAAPNKNESTNTVAQVTNAVPQIPKSVFVVPETPKDGRDPFYPNATSLYASPGLLNPTNVTSAAFELLILKSLSPTLAQINRTLLAPGEEADVEVQGGRIHVRLVQIKSESVIVEVAGQQRELHLRPGA